MEELSPQIRRLLLDLAWEAIRARLSEKPLPSAGSAEELREKRGAFVSLKRRSNRELRGCIGHTLADLPLGEAVTRAAVAAATDDSRFSPVTLEELPSLTLEISVLGPLLPIRPEEVQVGTHGLVVHCQGRSGLLLPQVPGNYGWDRETFLDYTCRKAGLAPATWRKPECEILGFAAFVFNDDEA